MLHTDCTFIFPVIEVPEDIQIVDLSCSGFTPAAMVAAMSSLIARAAYFSAAAS
jgi:hypothetical protein